jgi:hypothetical protein
MLQRIALSSLALVLSIGCFVPSFARAKDLVTTGNPPPVGGAGNTGGNLALSPTTAAIACPPRCPAPLTMRVNPGQAHEEEHENAHAQEHEHEKFDQVSPH